MYVRGIPHYVMHSQSVAQLESGFIYTVVELSHVHLQMLNDMQKCPVGVIDIRTSGTAQSLRHRQCHSHGLSLSLSLLAVSLSLPPSAPPSQSTSPIALLRNLKTAIMGLPQAISALSVAKELIGIVPVIGTQLGSMLGAAGKVCEVANVRVLRRLSLAAGYDC